MKKPQLSKKQLILLIISLVVVVIMVILFCLRGWIRNGVVPAYVEATYGKELKDFSQKTLLPAQEQVTPFGFDFEQHRGYVPDKLCGLAYFYDLHETVHCGIHYTARIVSPTAAQKDDWAARSNSVETWLAARGWNKEYGTTAQSFSELMHSEYASIQYRKQERQTTCLFSVTWQGYESYASAEPLLTASASCTGAVKFLGGSDKL